MQHRNLRTYGELWDNSPSECLARFYSDLLNPVFIPAFFFGFGLTLTGMASKIFWEEMAIVLLFFTIIPYSIIWYFLFNKQIKSLDLPDRANRLKPFLSVLGSYFLGIIILRLTSAGAFNMATVFALCLSINALTGMLITTRWKISIHTASVAYMSTAFIFMETHHLIANPNILKNSLIWSSLLLIPIMIWARFKLGFHRISENLAGALLGVFLTYIELLVLIK